MHIQLFFNRLMRELGAVNAQLAESLQQNGFYPVPLKKQRAALEEEVEEVALQQHRLLQSSNGNSGGNGGGSSSKETAADVIDLCSAVKSTAYASNYSNAPYSVPNSTTANSNGYYSGGGGGSGGGGVSSGLGNSQQLSPQLAAVSRLATSGDTPIAVHSYNSNFTRSAAAVAYTGNSAAAAAYGGGYGSNDNNNINFGGAGNSGGYVSHSMAGAGSTGNNSNNNRYNPSTYPPTSSAYANGSSGGTGASFAHYAGSGAGAAAAAASAGVPVLSKTSAFARDEFDPDFEDAVNDNDFTDWAVGGPTQQDYHQGGGGSGNSGGGGGAAAVAYQGFGGGGGGDDEFGDNGASDYAAAGGGGRGSYGGGGQGSAYNNNSNYTNSNNSTNYGAGGSSSSHRSPTAVLDNVPLPLCHCGNLTILCTSRTEATRGLKFFSCTGTRGTDAHCGFFQWEDPTLAPDNSNNFNNSNGMYQNGVQGGGGDQVVKDHTVEIQERFGHVGFRQGQLGCVEAALSGKDVFCLMPTGGGKSVVYQVQI